MSSRWRVEYTSGEGRNAGERKSVFFESGTAAEEFAQTQVDRGHHASLVWLASTEAGAVATLVLSARWVDGELRLLPPQ